MNRFIFSAVTLLAMASGSMAIMCKSGTGALPANAPNGTAACPNSAVLCTQKTTYTDSNFNVVATTGTIQEFACAATASLASTCVKATAAPWTNMCTCKTDNCQDVPMCKCDAATGPYANIGENLAWVKAKNAAPATVGLKVAATLGAALAYMVL